MELFEIAGEQFYFDLDKINDYVKIDENPSKNLDELLTKNDKEEDDTESIPHFEGPMIDMTKWDLVKGMIEVILSEQSIIDEDMGITMLGKQLSIPSRLSFNTLLKYKLIKINK